MAAAEIEPANAGAADAPPVPANPIPPSADQSGTALNDLQIQLFRCKLDEMATRIDASLGSFAVLYENKSPAVNAAFEASERIFTLSFFEFNSSILESREKLECQARACERFFYF